MKQKRAQAVSHEVRVAGTRDAAQIAALHIASWRAAYRAELPAEFLDGLDLATGTGYWRSRIESGEVEVMLMERSGTLLGFCAHGWSRDDDADGDTWEITNLHIAPDLRGGGLGGELFHRALAEATDAGARRLTLWVVQTNDPARRFYERKGMRLEAGTYKRHEFEPGAVLHEVRYAMDVVAS